MKNGRNDVVEFELDALVTKRLPKYFGEWNNAHMKPFDDLGSIIVTSVQAIATTSLMSMMLVFCVIVLHPRLKNNEPEVASTPSISLMFPPPVLMKVESIRMLPTMNAQ